MRSVVTLHATFGAVVSTTLTLVAHRAARLEPSVTEQSTGVVPSGKNVPGPGEQVGASVPQQTSDAVAATIPVAPLLPVHSRTFCAGHVIVGGVVSTTFTLEEHCCAFPDGSVAEQVTGVVPSGKAPPEAGLHDGDKVPAHTSDALAVNVAVVLCDPVHSSVCGVGHVIDGCVVSTTRTVVVQLAGFAAASCARQVTELSPRAKPEPDGGLQPSSTAMPQLSLRLGPANDTGVVAPAHSTAAGVEQVIDGPVLSATVTSAVHVSVTQLRDDPTVNVTVVFPSP